MNKTLSACYSLLLAAIVLLPATALKAQKALKAPLSYMPADSVVVWGQGYSDLRGVALSVDASLTEQPLGALSGSLKSAQKAWEQRVKKSFRFGEVLGDDETSSVLAAIEMANQSAQLFLHTGSGRYVDLAEHLLYNNLLREAVTPGPSSFEKHTAAQALVNGMGCIYATDDEGVWVNLYINSTTHVKTSKMSCIIDQLTDMPFSGRVKIRLSGMPHNAFRLKLRLRLPLWASATAFPTSRYAFSTSPSPRPMVYVNGREPLEQQIEGDYLVIDRAWNRGDEVLFTFPLAPRLVFDATIKGQTACPVAIMRGPLLYAIPDSCLSAPDSPILPRFGESINEMELPVLQGRFADDDASSSALKTFTALPYFLTKGRLWQPVSSETP